MSLLNMSRVESMRPSHLDVHCLDSPGLKKALDVFLNLLSSCAGPSGKIHVVRNSSGGHVTFTSVCARLLASMLVTFPELKLIVASVQSHLIQYSDCGLFMSCTCLQIIGSSVSSGIHFHVHKLLLESFVQIVVDYLTSSDCTVSVSADFTNIQILLAYVKSILTSKRLLNINSSNCCKLSELVMKAFVESIPAESAHIKIHHSDGVYILDVEGLDVNESHLEHGLLLEFPDLSGLGGTVDLESEIGVKNSGSGEVSSDGPVKVALFTCSLSGDMEEIVDAKFEVTIEQSELVENIALDKIINFCDYLEKHDVDLILCQKVIHPKIKASLRSKGILFADRLGSQKIPYLQDLTDAQPITSVIATLDLNHHLGWIDSLKHTVINGRSYLHLSRSSSHVVTLALCASFEERRAELKYCVKTSLRGLHSLVKEHRLLAGGGCWQTHCSYVLRDKVYMQLNTLAEKTGCTKAQVLSSLAVFRLGLHHWVRSLARSSEDVLVDPSSFHCWRVPKGKGVNVTSKETCACCCGLKIVSIESLQDFNIMSEHTFLSDFHTQTFGVSKILATDSTDFTYIVLDNFTAATQALERSVSVASLVLSIGLYITDKN